KDKLAVYLAECRAMGIEVLVPDINLSVSEFTAVRAAGPDGRARIPFGLSAIRNVGEGLVERMVTERESRGPFKDFYDFCNRVDPVVLNKRSVESLVKAGAFDCLGHPRQGLCLVYEQVIERTLARRKEADQGVLSLFGLFGSGAPGGAPAAFDDTRVPIPDQGWDEHTKLAFEKEMLGLYVSGHPLIGVETALRRQADCTILDLREDNAVAGAAVTNGDWQNGGRWVGGVVTGLARRYTKKGELMATFTLEDLQSSIEVFVFPRVMAEVGHLLANDAVVCVKGRLDVREDVPKLICSELKRPPLSVEGHEPLHVVTPIHGLDDGRVQRLRELLCEHSGGSPVYLHVGSKVVRLAPEFNVATSPGLLAELRVLLGPACLWNAEPRSV
ncbi:MAG TPA: OB-fold nucleic acid binding domain-containing protein, partial [Acidimicrobiales bacterium]|nr:OB-fold nucleic acid binding domain-containing protein [Acidimicrobiales bacterium]